MPILPQIRPDPTRAHVIKPTDIYRILWLASITTVIASIAKKSVIKQTQGCIRCSSSNSTSWLKFVWCEENGTSDMYSYQSLLCIQIYVILYLEILGSICAFHIHNFFLYIIFNIFIIFIFNMYLHCITSSACYVNVCARAFVICLKIIIPV